MSVGTTLASAVRVAWFHCGLHVDVLSRANDGRIAAPYLVERKCARERSDMSDPISRSDIDLSFGSESGGDSERSLSLSLSIMTKTGGTNCAACTLILAIAMQHTKLEITSPDTLCQKANLCHKHTCKLFPTDWPPSKPTKQPIDPTNNRRLSPRTTTSIGGSIPPPLARLLSRVRDAAAADDAAAIGHLVRSYLGTAPAEDSFFSTVSSLAASHATASARAKERAKVAMPTLEASHPCKPFNESCLVDRFLNMHLPISDADGDSFAPPHDRTLRGSHWRGADCDDGNANVYPGRQLAPADASVDHDCNGISGSNASGSYEQLFCAGTPRRGFIHIGDSATAHFHLPPAWLDPSNLGDTKLPYTNFLADAEDELDQPACAWGTGYKNYSDCPAVASSAPAAAAAAAAGGSIAARLRERNLCNHRDFQNVGVNGARSTDANVLADSAARAAATDHPALVIISLIGNDVCNGHNGTTHMTPPLEYREKILGVLKTLDAKLPHGSFVLLVGLARGSILYEAMHARQHPVGASYPDLYTYLTCLEVSPCNGWLSVNATMRNVTDAWAESLNDQLAVIASDASTFDAFEVGHIRPGLDDAFAPYVQAGGDLADLIEPSDGFHPSQIGNELLAAHVWKEMLAKYPQAVGAVNPHNAEIRALFGDQGGF